MSNYHILEDIHGQYHNLIRFAERDGFPLNANYLIFGDYVDWGKQSLEIICHLFVYKIKYPENHLLRENLK